MAQPQLVYHERQEAALCGCHALNNLVQGRVFNEVDLADIAAELDDAERALMFEAGGDTSDVRSFLAEESGNVDDSGNFSVTVLSEALSRAYGITLSAADGDVAEALQDPLSHGIQGFVANLREHWFTLRYLHGSWVNLDSMQSGPTAISDFFLSAYLAQLKQQQYYLFVARQGNGGDLPALNLMGVPSRNLHSMVDVRSGKAAEEGETARKAARKAATASASGDRDFAAALLASRRDTSGGAGARSAGHVDEDMEEEGGDGQTEEAQMAAAIAASLGMANGADGKRSEGAISGGLEEEEDEDLRRALALSVGSASAAQLPAPPGPAGLWESAAAAAARLLAALPAEPPADVAGTARLQLRIPSGVSSPAGAAGAGAGASALGLHTTCGVPSPVVRRFRGNESMHTVRTWAAAVWLGAFAATKAQALGGAGGGVAASAEGEKPFPLAAFALVAGGAPPRVFGSEQDVELTLSAAGLCPSAALTLRP